MNRPMSCSVAAMTAMAFAAAASLPALATGEQPPDPTISKEVTSGPCLSNPEEACPRPPESVSIVNPSFEDDNLADGTWIQGSFAAGWSAADVQAGPFNPSVSQLLNVPDALNVAFSNGPAITQALGTNLADVTEYTLSVDVCRRQEAASQFGTFVVTFGADGNVLASADETSIAALSEGECDTVVVSYTTNGDSEIGTAIEIALDPTVDAQQVLFDNVTLVADRVDDEVVSAVQVKPDETYAFDFTITVQNATDDLLVLDTLPAEWIATDVTEDGTPYTVDVDECGDDDSAGNATLEKGGKRGKKCKSATQIEWVLQAGDEATLKIDAETRQSPGRGHGRRGGPDVYAPTSCGALHLNDGAVLLEAIEGLEPEVLAVTRPLCLAVVEDIDGGGIDPSGDGDEDGDGLGDWREACGVLQTNPCEADSDFDGIEDLGDRCALEGIGEPNDGMVVDTGADGVVGEIGCLRPTLCNDTADNDGDGQIDSDDAACTSNEVDSEDPFDDEDNDGDGDDECLGDNGGGVVDLVGCPIPD
jgi:hypothetical protein